MPADILCVFESSDGKITPAVSQALALARVPGSHLTVVSAMRLMSHPSSPISSSLIADAIATANEQARSIARSAAKEAEDAARIAGINHSVSLHEDSLTGIAEWLGRRARLADLTVVDRPVNMVDARQAFFEDALFSSGRPVLVATPDHCTQEVKRLAVAWNGTRVAARALGDALACFPQAKHIDVIVVTDDRATGVPGSDVAQHLARRGLNANVVDVAIGDSIAETLNAAARQHNADVLVMGGFGHSRLREFILGGVTRELTATAHRPLFLSH